MKACSISDVGIIKGISGYLGINVIESAFTGDYETRLTEKARKALACTEKYDFVILHINGADTCSHDRDFAKKVRFLERVDREVFSRVTATRHMKIAVICDHITSSRTGEHIFGSVPFLLYCNGSNGIGRFDEISCRNGFVTESPMRNILQAGAEQKPHTHTPYPSAG